MLKLEGSRGNAALFFYTSLPALQGRGLLARNNVAGAAFNKAIVRILSAAVRLLRIQSGTGELTQAKASEQCFIE